MYMPLCLYSLLFSSYMWGCLSSLSCKNENNKDVDWFIILKIPASYNYFYLSSDSDNGKWIIPNYALNNENNLLALTLRQMYNSPKSDAFYALYNDEKPYKMLDSSKSRGGHLKGVVNFDGKTGYWLVHSVPKFPSKYKYDYTNGESINGQSFLCVSLGLVHLKIIASQLLMMYADVYDYNFPSHFSDDSDLLNKLYELVLNKHTPGLKSQRIDFATLKGVKLAHFGKSETDYKDLYHDIIGPGLNASLFVESWMNGPGEKIHSNCLTDYKVYNVQKVSIDGIEYSETIDHSKWAVSASMVGPIVCIGDINRMETQMSRGGGSLCVFDTSIWKTFSPIVKEYEPCRKYDFIL